MYCSESRPNVVRRNGSTATTGRNSLADPSIRWAYANKVTLEFLRPGKSTDNVFIESFNGSLRDECLNTHWFSCLTDAQEKLDAWRRDYNGSRPHKALNGLTPHEYLAQWAHKQRSEIL